MLKVLPHRIKYLRLLPLASLRERISGRVGLDVDVLRSVTCYTGCGDGDEYVERFWRVLHAFSPDERRDYLKFVWGRTRLPNDVHTYAKADWHKIKLQEPGAGGQRGAEGARNPKKIDGMLTQSHTCDFQLELPQYGSDEVCRRQLLTSMAWGDSMDNDN